MKIWNIFREMERLQEQLSELSKELGWGFGRFHRHLMAPPFATHNFPAMNIWEDDETVYVEALAPGLDISKLKVSVLNDTLTISGERSKLNVNEDKFHRNERICGRFTRTIELPTQIDSEKVTAEYKNGILFLTLPKAEAAKPKQIEIKVE